MHNKQLGIILSHDYSLIFQTIESFLEETLPAIPDHVLDSTIPKAPDSSSYTDDFSDVLKSLPPPYTNSKQKISSCLI